LSENIGPISIPAGRIEQEVFMQIKNILLPVDGSIYSDHATAYAVYLARLSGAHITAVCCHELSHYKQDVGELLVSELQINVEKQAAGVLKKNS
jgi:hypothetical protein